MERTHAAATLQEINQHFNCFPPLRMTFGSIIIFKKYSSIPDRTFLIVGHFNNFDKGWQVATNDALLQGREGLSGKSIG